MLDANRVKVLDNGQVLLDGKPMGMLRDEDAVRSDHQVPKTLPDGTTGFKVTDLGNGWLFLSGGYQNVRSNELSLTTRRTFLWNKSAKKLETGPSLGQSRAQHQITKLRDGRLLISGGISTGVDGAEYTKHLEIYDPIAKTLVSGGSLQLGRLFSGILRLRNGSILFVGGQANERGGNMETNSIELYEPTTASSRYIGSLQFARQSPHLLELPGGQALVIDGYNSDSEPNSNSLPPEVITVPSS